MHELTNTFVAVSSKIVADSLTADLPTPPHSGMSASTIFFFNNLVANPNIYVVKSSMKTVPSALRSSPTSLARYVVHS